MSSQSIQTHLDPATVEECAKVAENFPTSRYSRVARANIASAIRSLTAGREIQNSAGGPSLSRIPTGYEQNCTLCGAVVHDPCTTAEQQAKCELPDFCFPKSAAPVVRQDCAPAETGWPPPPHLRENSDQYPRSDCGTQRCADLGCFGYCQPSPSQPVAGLMEREIGQMICCPDQCMAIREGGACYVDRDTFAKSNVGKSTARIIDRLTSSPVSEEELAKAIAASMDKFYVPPIHLHAARALLSQFSIGRK